MRFLKVVFASMLGYILAVGVIVSAMVILMIGLASTAKPDVVIPHDSVLMIKLNYPLQDQVNDEEAQVIFSVLDPNMEIPVGLNKLLHTIEQAATDDRIEGIILDLTFVQSGYAKLSEVRDQLEEFRNSGKFIYAYADYYYYPTYYMASVADSIFINPEGQMAFNGMVAEVAFFSNTLKKLGVDMQVVRAGKFKGAVEPYTREDLSPANREQIQAYINSVFGETLNKISASRDIPVDTLKKHADEMKLRSINDFIANHYIDRAVYRDEFYNSMKRRMGVELDEKVSLMTPIKYSKQLDSKGSGRDRIAVIYAGGEIVGGHGSSDEIGAENMAMVLKKVRENERIKAVVLRIDSRGGSSLASDIIWREARLLADEKPLIVSMGDVAASGGYYIALAGDTIVAQPTTITGSIGVFGLIPNAQKLLNDKLGVTFDYVGTGSHSDFGRIDRAMTDHERQYIEEIVDDIYETFLTRVSDARGITRDEAHELAQGRVWTGVMAKEIGLVDELGGLERAIEIAASKADLETYKVSEYPKADPAFMAIMRKIQGDVSLESQIAEQTQGTSFGSYIEHLRQFNELSEQHRVQALMPYDITVKNYLMR